MTEENIQLPNYVCFKPSKVKIGQNGIYKNFENNFFLLYQ